MLPKEYLDELSGTEVNCILTFVGMKREHALGQITVTNVSDFERRAIFAGQMHQLFKDIKAYSDRRDEETDAVLDDLGVDDD